MRDTGGSAAMATAPVRQNTAARTTRRMYARVYLTARHDVIQHVALAAAEFDQALFLGSRSPNSSMATMVRRRSGVTGLSRQTLAGRSFARASSRCPVECS